MMIVYIMFVMLLAYEIHSRKVEEEESRKGYPNPYENCEWFKNDPRVAKTMMANGEKNEY